MSQQKENSRFRHWLIRRRMEMGLSQRKLASLAGISPGYIARIESGSSYSPSFSVIAALALVLDTQVDEIPKPASKAMSFTQISKNYPRASHLFRTVLSKMSRADLMKTIDRLEKRLGLFDEDLEDVSDTFIKVLSGKVHLDDDDGSVNRPAGHYLRTWSQEIEDWVSAEQVFDDL